MVVSPSSHSLDFTFPLCSQKLRHLGKTQKSRGMGQQKLFPFAACVQLVLSLTLVAAKMREVGEVPTALTLTFLDRQVS